jgi:hypothetical protein
MPRMNLRAGALLLAFALPVALAPPARADAPAIAKTIVVVAVDPGATGIDAAELRGAIGEELEATAVAPDDALAPQARGTVGVSVDRAAHALVVSYREGTAPPITRTIELPGDAAATARAAVLLAGNLARDEASELAAALRKARPLSPALGSSNSYAAPAEPVDDEAAKLDLLGATLESHARYGHGVRRTIAWTMAGVGLAAEGVGLGVLIAGHSNTGWVLVADGTTMSILSALVAPRDFDKLEQYYEYQRAAGLPAELARQDVEQAWLRSARNERWNRKFLGWTEIIVGSIGAGLSVAFLPPIVEHPSERDRTFLAGYAGFLVTEATGLAAGISWVATDGPIESALHAYEASVVGHAVTPGGLSDVGPRFSLGKGGGILGIGGRF